MIDAIGTNALAKASQVIDHLLLGIADLDLGIDSVEKMTGTKAALGGSHPGAGTQNALLSLGNRQYLEIISIDPAQRNLGRMADIIKSLMSPRIITWAAATTDICALAQKAKAIGLDIDGPNDGARVKPDGSTLKWKTLNIITDFGGVIPFFIEWGAGGVHPSVDSPPGCSLLEFEIEHPSADQVRQILRLLGIEAAVKQGREARMKSILLTPKGKVELS
jgi:hypothetical protein